MTDATPLASEQITQEDREPCEDGQHCCCCGPGEPCCDCGEIMPDWHAKAKEFAEVALGNAMRIGELEIELIRANERIAALSAIPAPSDQDASQAQGEVPAWQIALDEQETECRQLRKALIAMGRMIPGVLLADDVSSDFLATLPGEMAHYRLSPAPGATVQDGGKAWDAGFGAIVKIDGKRPDWVRDNDRLLMRRKGSGVWTGRSWYGFNWNDFDAIRAEADHPHYAAPTPTIPAGMVAENLEAQRQTIEACARVAEGYYNGRGGHPEIRASNAIAAAIRKLSPNDALAAAPKQAEQQGVEQFALARLTEMTDHGRIDAAYGNFSHPALTMIADVRKLIAALNAPTGAVEKEPGCESVLTALRNLRRSIEETGAKHSTPALKEAFDQATIVLGRGY